MRTKNKRKKKNKNLVLRVAILAAAVYCTVVYVQAKVQLAQGQKKLDAIYAQQAIEQAKAESLKEQKDNQDQYKEEQARKQGMAKPGETIIYEIEEG